MKENGRPGITETYLTIQTGKDTAGYKKSVVGRPRITLISCNTL